MYRWTTLLLALLFAAALTAILLTPVPIGAPEVPVADEVASARDAGPEPDADVPLDAATKTATPPEAEVVTPVAVGPLPTSAPKNVSFGVILVRYAGAEGAPAGTRSKEEAERLAASLVAEAAQDFSAAVARGDRGSTANAGRVPQNVLEPPLEYALFTLEPGEVYSEPVDTPRGFWIVKRLK